MQLYFIMQENVLFSIKTLYYKRINVYWDQSDVGQEAMKRFYRSLNVLCTVYGFNAMFNNLMFMFNYTSERPLLAVMFFLINVQQVSLSKNMLDDYYFL